MNYVRIMADFTATGLWSEFGHMMEPSELPVPSSLLEELEEWVHEYEDMDGSATTTIWKEWNERGLVLAHKIKELLPDWKVMYFDECKFGDCGHAIIPCDRSEYEFEITLQPGVK